MASPKATGLSWEITWLAFALYAHLQTRAEQSQGAYFLPEFALSPQGSFLEDTTGEQFLTYRYDDQDLVGEDKQLEYDLAGGQQNPGEDGPREGGEMTFAAALWQQFGFGGGKARSEITAADKEEAYLSAGWCH